MITERADMTTTTIMEVTMRVRFHPQAWVNDYAIEVDPEGEIEWEVGAVPDDMEDDTYESDDLRCHPNAPQWARDWYGPFWIEILRVN